jgi:DNA polymerase III sliding clamp (beta) subunit (PCNA family)
MLIQRQTLVNALGLLKPGLSNKDIIEQGLCFNFNKDTITTFNDLISVSIPLETGIEGAVRAEELHKLLDRITADEIELTQTESELRIKAGKIKAGLSLKAELLPPLAVENEWQELPKQFKEAIGFCQFSTSKDMTRPHLTCIHFEGVKVSSSDRWRITQFAMTEAIPVNFLLPASAANILLKYNITHMALDNAWVHFADAESGLVFSTRLILADLMQPDQYFDVQGQVVRLPDLDKTLERAKIMVEGDSDLDLTIKLILEPGKLICRGQKEIGWVEEVVDLDYNGSPITMMVNPLFLADILSRTKEMIVSENMCLFWGENFRHVMMLVKE